MPRFECGACVVLFDTRANALRELRVGRMVMPVAIGQA